MKNSLWLTILNLGLLILNLTFQLELAYSYGAGAELDAYLVAMTIPNLIYLLLANGMQASLIPFYVQIAKTHSPERAYQFFQTLLFTTCASLILIAVIASNLSNVVLSFFFSELPAYTLNKAIELTPWMWLTVITNTIFLLLAYVQQARGHYLSQGIPPLVGIIFMILSLLLFAPRFGIWAYIFGGIGGSVLQILFLFPRLPHSTLFNTYKPSFQWNPLFSFLRTSWPLFATGIIVRATPLIDRTLTAGLAVGTISQLNYAYRFMTLLISTVIAGFAVVLFTSLSNLAEDIDRFTQKLLEGFLVIFYLFVPTLITFVLLSDLIIEIILVRGSFTYADGKVVTRAIMLYSPYALFAAIGTITGRGLYALQMIKLATILDTLGVFLYAMIAWLGVKAIGIDGIPLAFSLYYAICTILAGYFLFKKLGRFPFVTFKTIMAYSIMVLTLTTVIFLLKKWQPFNSQLITIFLSSTLGVASFLVMGYLFKAKAILYGVSILKKVLHPQAIISIDERVIQ